MRKIRTYADVADPATEDLLGQVVAQRDRLAKRLASVGRVVAVASGKGGVGKSAVTANLAALLASRGHRVGALDADLNGPSLARMLGVVGRRLEDGPDGPVPPRGVQGVKVVSMELLQEDEDSPLRWKEPGGDAWLWRGPLEAGTLREFISDVHWGELDFLLIDVPPGTDRIARLLELVPEPDRVVLVTTPSRMARAVVARSVRLVRESQAGDPVLVENMTEWVCPDCGERTALFDTPDSPADAPGPSAPGEQGSDAGGAIEVWARIPFDPRLAAATDGGRPWAVESPDSPAGRAFGALADRLLSE